MEKVDVHRQYEKGALNEEDLLEDPIAQCQSWLNDAVAAHVIEPYAMTLATASLDARPSARIVLLRGLDARGFSFYTNYESRKSQELVLNPRAALILNWLDLERQVRVEGDIDRIGHDEAATYFAGRPRQSQLSAWASPQSQPLKSRTELDDRTQAVDQKFAGQEIPMPPFWGGYRVVPHTVEFWQGRRDRQHDRFVYTLIDAGWVMQRLAP